MNENFNNKIGTLKLGFDDLSNIFTEQIEMVKENLKSANEKYKREYQESIRDNLIEEKNAFQGFATDYKNFKLYAIINKNS